MRTAAITALVFGTAIVGLAYLFCWAIDQADTSPRRPEEDDEA